MGGENNLTALYIASYYGKADIVELLLQHEPKGFKYLANNNIFINTSHRHKTISKLLCIAKIDHMKQYFTYKLPPCKYKHVRANFNYIDSLKC